MGQHPIDYRKPEHLKGGCSQSLWRWFYKKPPVASGHFQSQKATEEDTWCWFLASTSTYTCTHTYTTPRDRDREDRQKESKRQRDSNLSIIYVTLCSSTSCRCDQQSENRNTGDTATNSYSHNDPRSAPMKQNREKSPLIVEDKEINGYIKMKSKQFSNRCGFWNPAHANEPQPQSTVYWISVFLGEYAVVWKLR